MSSVVVRLVFWGVLVGYSVVAKLAGWFGESLPDGRPVLEAPEPRVDEVADVAVRIGRVNAERRLEAYALVPGGPQLRGVSGAELADDDALPAHVREHLREVLPHATFHSDGRRLWMRDHSLTDADLDAAVVVVAELARRGVEAIHALRELPGAVYDAPRGPWDARTPPRVRLPDHAVTFELHARYGGGARTVAWTEIGTSPVATLPPQLVHEGARLVHPFRAVETDATSLLAAAEMLRFAAASARAGRYG